MAGGIQNAGCCLLLLLLGVAGVLTLLATQGQPTLFHTPHATSSNHHSHFVHSEVAAGVEYPGKTYKSFAVSGTTQCKSACEADSLCASWVQGSCFGGKGLQAHVCYLREATVDLSDAQPTLDDCSAYGGRILRSSSDGSAPAQALPKGGADAGAPAKPGFSTSYAEAGAEYKGKIYASFPSIDAQKCKASCLQDFRCSNWVLGLCTDGNGLQAHVCYLKTADGAPEHEKDECAAFGGTVTRVGPTGTDTVTVHKIHIPAVNYHSFATTSRYVCQSSCEADQRCGSWVHGLCSDTEPGAHECYLNTASQPQWPDHDDCAKFGGSVVRTAANGYTKPTHAPTAEPSQPATAAPVEEVSTHSPVASATEDDQSCVSHKDARGKITVTCKTLVHHHTAHYTVIHHSPNHFVEHVVHTRRVVGGESSAKNIHITVHTPKQPVPPPAPAAPQTIHLVVHSPPGAPLPPAAPSNNVVNVGSFPAGEVLNTPGLPKGVVEGSEKQGRHVIIHVDPEKDVTAHQKVINVDMNRQNAPVPQLAKQYNGLRDDRQDNVVMPLQDKNHNCQTTPTSAGNLVVTCTSLMN